MVGGLWARALIFALVFAGTLASNGWAADADGDAGSVSAASAGRPNLVTQNITLSSYSVRPGDLVTVAWTIRNIGSGNCAASFTGLHMGTSASTPPSTLGILDMTYTTPPIPAGGSVRQTNTVTIPSTASFGTYYLWVIADDVSNSSLNQTTKADDAARSSALGVENVRRQPNLRPSNIVMDAGSARPGDPVTVTWTISNVGNVLCPESLTGLHLGPSAVTPPTNDRLNLRVATPEIGPNASVRMTNTITIPLGTTLGTYYIWVVADDVVTSTLNQSSRTDDAARSSALSVVAEIARPNLITQDVQLSSYSARRSDQIVVMWTLTNAGNADAAVSTTGLHLGTSTTVPPTNDGLNLKVTTPAISPGASVRLTNVVTIPANAALGTHYIWVVADDVPNSTLDQSSKADDAARSAALTIATVVTRPNLVPQNILLGAYSARSGDSFTVMWTTTNSGSGNAAASLTGIHLGTSSTVPPTSDALNVRVSTPPIASHTSIRQTNTVTIPASTPSGNYYIWVVLDDVPTSILDQTSRADDAARSAVVAILTVPRQPNLVPRNVTITNTFALPGDRVTVRWGLNNSGMVTAPTSLTGLRLGQSATEPPTNNGPRIVIETPEVAVGATIQQTNSLVIPTNTPPGTYYLWVIADDVTNSTLNQSSRADDAARSPAFSVFTEVPRPNLIPSNVALSASAVRPGGQVTVSWTMTNAGNANAPASTTGLHLGVSTNAPPTTDGLNLKIATPAISANSAVRQTNVVTIPGNTAPGNYYLWVVADDVPNSTLNQSSKADDAARSGPLGVAQVTLNSPAAAETVGAPPTFSWSAAGISNPKVYLANEPAPSLGVDPVVIFDNPPGTNSFSPTATNWTAAVAELGFATNYYWTIGSADPAQPIVYAEWRPFKVAPLAVGARILPASGGDFRFEIVAPNQSQVVVQGAETLTSNWADLRTLPNTNGIVIFTDETAGTRTKRFYRAKP